MRLESILYLNTGFNHYNIPSSPDVLTECDFINLKNSQLNQSYGLSEFICEIPYTLSQQVDYIKIGDDYYIVEGMQRLNGDVTKYFISLDFYNSIKNLKINSGWLKRCCVSDPNNIWDYDLDEPFQPNDELQLDTNLFTSKGFEDNYPIIESTIDLQNYTKAFSLEGGRIGTINSLTLAPKTERPQHTTTFYIVYPDGNDLYYLPFDYVGSSFWDLSPDVQNTLQIIRSFGIDDSILSSYIVPSINNKYETDSRITGLIDRVQTSKINDIDNKITPAYLTDDNYFCYNKKCYKGQENFYSIFSTSSGDSKKELTVDDIITPNQNEVEVYFYRDTRPTGGCRFGFKYFKTMINFQIDFDNVINNQFTEIKSLEWERLPINFTERKGSAIFQDNFARKEKRFAVNTTAEMINQGVGLVGNIATGNVAGGIQGGVGLVQSGFNSYYDYQQLKTDKAVEINLTVPDLKFPHNDSIRDFFNDCFILCRFHLSDDDLKRKDLFLTQYGYTVNIPFKEEFLNNRTQFNYIQFEKLYVSGDNINTYYRNGVEEQLKMGVRLWHVKPVDIIDAWQNPVKPEYAKGDFNYEEKKNRKKDGRITKNNIIQFE